MENEYTWRFGVVLAIAWTLLVFLLLPIFVAVPFSLTPERHLLLPEERLSLRHYGNLLTNEAWLSSIGQSFVIASCSTAIAVVLGTLCAVGLWRIASRLSEALRGFMLMPLIVPPIVSALAFHSIWVDLRLLDTYLGMILSHMILGVPYVVITVSTSLANFDPTLELAARNLGASMSQRLRHVILPSIMPGVLSGAVFAFIWSWDEIVVTLFITSLRIFTLPRRMWDGIREHADPTIAACATALISLTLLGVILYMLIGRREKPGDKKKSLALAGSGTE
jgi:putative spermidine/putrescine transport system permease protein